MASLTPITEWARKEGISTKEAEARLRAFPGAIHQAHPKAKRWVNEKAIEVALVQSIATRVDRAEEDIHDLKLRVQDIEAKVA